MKTIEIRDCGPVEHLIIPVPDDGGVVVLRGACGTGKTHALAAVDALVRGDGRVPSRDGSLGATVEGLGVRLTMGRRANRSGELVVEALDGEDPSLLVDPGIKDPAAADAARIRALLRLARAEVSFSAFGGLLEGGEEALREICRPATLEQRDVPAMAAAVKRDLEAAARNAESKSANLAAEADGTRKAIEELGAPSGALSVESIEDARAAHSAAIRSHAMLEERARLAGRLMQAADAARSAIDSMQASGTDPSLQNARACVAAGTDAVSDLTAALARAESDLRAAKARERQEAGAAEQRAGLMRTLAAAEGARAIPAEEIAQAALTADQARAELEVWSVIQKTTGLRTEVERLSVAAVRAGLQARALRAAAAGTERVILEAVREICGDQAEIHAGRLYVRTDRGLELYEDLSTGERWGLALDVSVRATGEGGVLVTRQEAWQSFDPEIQAEIGRLARERRVLIIAAQVDSGGIRAEVEK